MRRRRALSGTLVLVALSAMQSHPAHADPILEVGGDAMELEADVLEVDVSAHEAILTGHVSLKKGDLVVHCPRIDMRFDTTPHITWAKGSGGVAADVKGVHAEAPEVELNLDKQLLDLRGGVRLTRGKGWLHADSARIDIATARVTLKQVKGSIPVAPKGR